MQPSAEDLQRALPAPAHLDELRARAASLRGCTLAELAARFAPPTDVRPGDGLVRRKGKTGQLVERALGATAGSRMVPDFPALGVELKTIPLDARGRPRESTFVCTLPLAEVDRASWQSSSVRAKLAHVLFVPIVTAAADRSDARIGEPFFWRPSAEQEAILRADFDDLVGLIALGQIEALTARLGHWLQVRPKAAHGRVRTLVFGPEQEPISTIPRGFYLRARATAMLLAEAAREHGKE